MHKLPLGIFHKLGVITLIGYIAWLAWVNLGPRTPEIGPVRRELADKVIADIVEDLRGSRGNLRQTALLHFENDPTNYFTNTLRKTIEQRGVLDLDDRTIMEKARNSLNLRHRSYSSTDAALAEGRSLDAECVVYGAIHAFESYSYGANIDVEVHFAEVDGGESLFTRRYRVDSTPETPAVAIRQASIPTAGQAPPGQIEQAVAFPWFKRLFGWMLIVLMLPVFTIAFIRTMVSKSLNKTNAFVLLVYTLADVLLAWLMLGEALVSFLPIAMFVGAVVFAFLYNVKIMTFALKLEA